MSADPHEWPESTRAALVAGLTASHEADPWLTAETERELAERDTEWWADDPTAYDLPMTGATYLRPGERRNIA